MIERWQRTLTAVTALVVVVGGNILLGEPERWSSRYSVVREAANRKRCAANLKQIGLGLEIYRDRHGGELPDRDGTALLSALYETEILVDREVYLCPSGTDRECGYVGRRNTGSSRLDPAAVARDGARIPLAADRSGDAHGDVRMVLLADGHVEEVLESEYRALFAPLMGE